VRRLPLLLRPDPRRELAVFLLPLRRFAERFVLALRLRVAEPVRRPPVRLFELAPIFVF
jgi:hypothetical protein